MKKLLSSFSFLLTLLSVSPIFAADEMPLASDATYDLEAHWHKGYGSHPAENRVLEVKLASDGFYQLFIIDKDSATFNEVQITTTPYNKYNASWGIYFDTFVNYDDPNKNVNGGSWSVVYAGERSDGGSDIYIKFIGPDTTGASAGSYPYSQLTDTAVGEGNNLDPDMNFRDDIYTKEIVYVRHNDSTANNHSTIRYLKFNSSGFQFSAVEDKNLTNRYSVNCPSVITLEGDALYPKWIDGSNVAFTFKFTDGGSASGLVNHDRAQVATVFKEETETDDGAANANDYYYSCGDKTTTFSSFMFVTDSVYDHYRPMPTWSPIYSTTDSNDQYGLVYYLEDAGVSQLAGSTLSQDLDPASSYNLQTTTSSGEQVLSDSTYNRLNPVFAPLSLGTISELWIAYERQDNDATNTAQIYGTRVELPEIKLGKKPPLAVTGGTVGIVPGTASTGGYSTPSTPIIIITPSTGGFNHGGAYMAPEEDKFPWITPTSVVDLTSVKVKAKEETKKWEFFKDGVVYSMTEYKSGRISTLKEQMFAEFELGPSHFHQTKIKSADGRTVTFVTGVSLGEAFAKHNTPNGIILMIEEKKSDGSSKNWEFPFIRAAHALIIIKPTKSSLVKFSFATDDEVRWTDCLQHKRYPEFAELLNTSDGTTPASDTPNDLVYVKVVDVYTDTDHQVTHLFDLPVAVEEECGEPTEPEEVEETEDCTNSYPLIDSSHSTTLDTDGDGVADACDACPDIAPYWDGKPFTDDDGNETCVEQSDCCSSCCSTCGGDITVTATASAFVGDITVTGGNTIVTVSYTGGSTTTSGGTTSGVDPGETPDPEDTGIASLDVDPWGADLTGSSGCTLNAQAGMNLAQSIQLMLFVGFISLPVIFRKRLVKREG